MDTRLHWKQSAIDKITLKKFVTSNSLGEDKTENKTTKNSNKHLPASSGEEVKSFYETILNETSENDCFIEQEIKKSSADTNDNNNDDQNNYINFRYINQAFNYAQNNNVEMLKKIIHTNKNFNLKDNYNWSLLMCAACAGAEDCVKYLLKNNAKTGYRDLNGNTALYLASKHGHSNIVELLINHNKGNSDIDCIDIEDNDGSLEVTKLYCSICKMDIIDSNIKEHSNSIAHQFSKGPVEIKTLYGIPSSNKGFEIMVKQGWDQNKGLGPQGSGKKFPVKTSLKCDRKGIGSTKEEVSKITHFGPGDCSSIKQRYEKNSTISKKIKLKKEIENKRREILLRQELNGPDL